MLDISRNVVLWIPTDIAEELVRIAGVAIVPYMFDWTLPPVAAFTRAGVAREIDAIFARGLCELYHERDTNRAT